MSIAVLTSFDNAKLRYIIDYVFAERLGFDYVLNPAEISSDTFVLSYGTNHSAKISIPDSGYLHSAGVSDTEPVCTTDADNNVYLFASDKSQDISFDIFAAIFFMLSRNEEYVVKERDSHGRFDIQHSFAFKHNFHQRAVVDEWIIMLRKQLLNYLPENLFKKDIPSMSVTIDVDMMYSYHTKGFFRNMAAWGRDLVSGKFKAFSERPLVLMGIKKDPYDTYDIVEKIRQNYNLQIIFFILASQHRTNYDKNGNLNHNRSINTIRRLEKQAIIGLHPSYYSIDDNDKLITEKNILEKISDTSIKSARCHYLRLRLPDTYRQMVNAGIAHDYTMGFASNYGFRAGTSRPFKFFDLTDDNVLPLTIHPFCVMDGSLKDYQQLSVEQAQAELIKISDYIKSINGHFEILIHNDTLSNKGRWKGWAGILENTIKKFYSK